MGRHRLCPPAGVGDAAGRGHAHGLGATLDLDMGYDAFGIALLQDQLNFDHVGLLEESLDANERFIRQGFFLDDHNGVTTSDGSGADAPELTISASIGVGASIGADVGNAERPVILYALPLLHIDRFDPDGFDSNTELEFGVELGGEVFIANSFWFISDLSISSHDGNEISLALGVARR